MNRRRSYLKPLSQRICRAVAILCVGLLVVVPDFPLAWSQQAAPSNQNSAAAKLPKDQLDSLVAPIALYPDPLLSQALVASTYPLEIVQLDQWMKKNPNLKDKALADAVSKLNLDPSIQGLVAFPEVVVRM